MLYQGFTPQNFNQGQHQVVGDINEMPMAIRWREETKTFVPLIVQKAKELKAETILDYGCGVGRMARGILDFDQTLKVIGVDQSENMLSLATQYNQEHIDSKRLQLWTVAEFDALPRETRLFNLAYCIYVIQHTPDWDVKKTIIRLADATDNLIFVNSTYRMALPKFCNDGANDLKEVLRLFPRVYNFIPAEDLLYNAVMERMFLTGGIRHYAFFCQQEQIWLGERVGLGTESNKTNFDLTKE